MMFRTLSDRTTVRCDFDTLATPDLLIRRILQARLDQNGTERHGTVAYSVGDGDRRGNSGNSGNGGSSEEGIGWWAHLHLSECI